jgi:hypothetical protein
MRNQFFQSIDYLPFFIFYYQICVPRHESYITKVAMYGKLNQHFSLSWFGLAIFRYAKKTAQTFIHPHLSV